MTAAPGSPSLARLDGVLFDVDDTLVDTQGAFAHALVAVARRYLPEVGPERDLDLVRTWRADVGGHYRSYTRGEVSSRTQRMARANALHADFGGPVLDDAGYDEWNALFEHTFQTAWAAHEDAGAAVDALQAAGLVVGALSNAPAAYQVGKLTQAGLIDRVPMLVGVDTLGFGKPDPRVFLEACRLLGTDPARTAYVGDELDIDASAAVAAGLVGVWLDRPALLPGPTRPHGPAGPDVLVVHTLADLVAVLTR
ncbi:HAD family hydrolase [Cellulomonas hominis]